MINRLEIRNWQSLVKVDITLGQLTAIVGPSSCGKTALMRALRALASNTRGGGSITSGAKTAAVTAHTETHKVTWQRGINDGGKYILTDTRTGTDETYTKLAGAVPDAITAALRIAPAPTAGTSLNIAGQFEAPFLLTESGAAVARLLGQLTNVSTILSAVQEANRRRLAFNQALKIREADLAEKVRLAQDFVTLPARLTARTRAESHADNAERLLARVDRLRGLVDSLTIAEGVLARAAQRQVLPDDARVRVAVDQLSTYKTHLRAWVSANNLAAATTERAQIAAQAEVAAQRSLDEALATAGYCPTCGRVVEYHPHVA